MSSVDGFGIVLGDVTTKGDGSWSPGAVALTNDVKVSDAVDQLNEVLAKLVPSAPPSFPNGSLSVVNATGNTPVLASGAVPDNSTGTSPFTAGNAVTRITATGVSGNTFSNVGPGDQGTLQLLVNGAVAGSKALTGTGDNGSYNGLVISGQADYPVSTPGFWKSINVSTALATVSQGINRFRLNHTSTSATNEVYFVKDNMTAVPAFSASSVAQNALGTVGYSSGVPHYTSGGSLTVGLSFANLSGETYYGGNDPVVISATNGIIAAQTFTYANVGIATPIPRQTTAPVALTPLAVSVNGSNVFAVGNIQAVLKNVNGSSAAANVSALNILAMIGTQSGKVYEMNVPVSNLGSLPNNNNAIRVNLPSGDTPAGATSAFVSSDALALYEAAVVAGVLKNDTTNYSVNYLPAGPDYSGKSTSQYVTFAFQRSAVSQFSIVVTGSYAGCWVKLPGVSDDAGVSPNATNGWWNMYQPYSGAGVPGRAGDPNAGAAALAVMAGAGGSYKVTFGTQSSTNSTNNVILVRFRLNASQSITALSFSN
ncbi:MAG: hypothetical protein EOP83_20225 [Verrucomicrobiaceae bacterium]|nr:MAG: hypothetical protein EOP83_20225 [Verrucomicrobiaceae bacterium]